jgi:hypothetical protein
MRRDSAVDQGKALVAVGAVTKTFTTPSMESLTRSLLTRSDEPNETNWSCHVDTGRVETATPSRPADLGHSLDGPLAALDRWTASYWHQVEAARQH